MLKLIPPDSYDFGEPPVRLVKMSSRGLLGDDRADFIKRAGVDFLSVLDNIKTAKDEPLIHLIALGTTESFGCFFAGAPVQTYDGPQPIETVAPGTMVLTHRNRFRRVAHAFKKPYSGRRAAIHVSGLPDPIAATAKHPFMVIRKRAFGVKARCACWNRNKPGWTKEAAVRTAVNQAVWADAEDIRKGDYVVVPTAPADPTAEPLAEDLAYVLGFYLAEGCIRHKYKKGSVNGSRRGKRSAMVFAAAKSDEASLHVLRTTARNRGYSLQERASRTSAKGWVASWNCKELADLCSHLLGDGARYKRLHPTIFAQSDAWKLQFLAGYFDGDGALSTNRKLARYENTLRASTASRALALDLQRLLASLLVPSSVSRCHNRVRNGCFGHEDFPIFGLSVGSAYSSTILAHCLRLQPVRTTPRHKQARAFTCGDYMLLPVSKVEIDEVEDEIYNLEVEGDNTYVVDVIGHNSNRNGDGFTSQTCRKYHDTFVKHARLFRDHCNKDKAKSYGIVKFSAFNEPMQRVELLIALNGSKAVAERNGGLVADKELEKLASGRDLGVSMACGVPFDSCSYCHNKAPSRAQYCTDPSEGGHCKAGGLKHNMGSIVEVDGDLHHLHADNPDPKFFDISHVFRPADRIAYVTGIMKAAGHRKVSGAELAELAGITVPDVLLYSDGTPQHVQQLLKTAYAAAEVEAVFDRSAPNAFAAKLALAPAWQEAPLDPPPFAREKFAAVLRALADEKICLPLPQFLELVTGQQPKEAAATAEVVRAMLPGAFSRLLALPDLPGRLAENPYTPAPAAPTIFRNWAAKHAAAWSMDPRHVDRRIHLAVIRGVSGALREAPGIAIEKQAADGRPDPVLRLAEEYMLYKLAFLCAIPEISESDKEMPLTRTMTVLQNYI